MLIAHAADVNLPNTNGNTPLLLAAQSGRLDVVMAFIRGAGLDPSKSNTLGENLLILSARAGFEDLVAQLIKMRPNLDHADIKGQTALYAAAEMGHTGVVRILLESKADVNGGAAVGAGAEAPPTPADARRPPIVVAAFMRNVEIVQMLLDYKADINAVDHTIEGRGSPAFVRCAERGNIGMVRLLLKAKADPAIKRKSDNKSALAASFDSYQRGMVVALAEAMHIDLAEITATARMKNLAGVMPFQSGKEYSIVVAGTADAGKMTLCL